MISFIMRPRRPTMKKKKFSSKLLESKQNMAKEQLNTNEAIVILPSTTMVNNNNNNELGQPMVDEQHSQFDDDEDFILHQDSLEHIDIEHTIKAISPRNSISSRNNTMKSGQNILKFEQGNGEDPWKDDKNINEPNSVINIDYKPPCPYISSKLPYCCIVCCCCCWSNYDRQQCSLALLYTKFYLSIYILSILITIALLIYDLSNGSIMNENLDKEPIWFISLDIFCVGLMVFDIIIQIQANNNYKKFFKSILNLFDFIIVFICVISIPIYWFAPDWILSVVLLSRFIVRMLRIITVIRHQKFRKEYISARDAIVDFTKYNEQNNINQAATNNTNEQFL